MIRFLDMKLSYIYTNEHRFFINKQFYHKSKILYVIYLKLIIVYELINFFFIFTIKYLINYIGRLELD